MNDPAGSLAEAISAIDGLLDGALDRDAVLDDGPPSVAASGPRAESDPSGYRLALEQIREGHLLHAGGGRLVRTDDRDLALLAGDALYAGGLGLIARLGDADAIVELSRLIASCAVAKADRNPDAAERAWESSCRLIGGHD